MISKPTDKLCVTKTIDFREWDPCRHIAYCIDIFHRDVLRMRPWTQRNLKILCSPKPLCKTKPYLRSLKLDSYNMPLSNTRSNSQALGPLEPWAPRDAEVAELHVTPVTIIIMLPDDDVGDGEWMELLPEIVGEKGFLESISPTFRDRL
ncbi:hypothetical protein TNCV_3051301 [Trichonephila clavipes]|nr:hypothetical protein TNCV_3051301 [Trichonephila clavipes]